MNWTSVDEPPNLEVITKIDISCKNLEELPKWISKCSYLRELYCINNQLTYLAKKLYNINANNLYN